MFLCFAMLCSAPLRLYWLGNGEREDSRPPGELVLVSHVEVDQSEVYQPTQPPFSVTRAISLQSRRGHDELSRKTGVGMIVDVAANNDVRLWKALPLRPQFVPHSFSCKRRSVERTVRSEEHTSE